MEKEQCLENILNGFVFQDHRLGDHPMVRVSVFWKERDGLVRIAHTPNIIPKILHIRPSELSLSGLVIRKKAYLLVTEVEHEATVKWHELDTNNDRIGSVLCVPIIYGEDVLGTISFDSIERFHFEEKHIGLIQLLAALLIYSQIHLEDRIHYVTPASIGLGKALKQVREEIGLSQIELADRIKQNRITISQWERGAQPPTIGPFYTWCLALGILSPSKSSIVKVIDITPSLLKMLKEDPRILRELSPSQFEHFVAERLDRMGFDVTLTGAISQRDGGIDLIAVPKIRTVGTFLLAGQIKHHRGDQKTGRQAVDRLLAWKNSYFRLGLLATNTGFTKDALWIAEQEANRPFIRLRDFEDMKRWIQENFWSEEDWHEIPDEIVLAPGMIIKIPKPRLVNSLEIWPLSKLNINDIKP